MRRVTITARAGDLRALLAALPRCSRCSARAEVTLDGHLFCVTCVPPRPRRGRLESLHWADAADTIEAALSQFESEGSWQTKSA